MKLGEAGARRTAGTFLACQQGLRRCCHCLQIARIRGALEHDRHCHCDEPSTVPPFCTRLVGFGNKIMEKGLPPPCKQQAGTLFLLQACELC